MTDAILRRLPVKGADGSIDLIEIDGIFYLEAQGDDTPIRPKGIVSPISQQRRHHFPL
jgi:hypothetical protein